VKKLAFIAQKGGVGKTTMAVNLAVAAGRTALFDLDQQESAVVWADRRQDELPHVEFLTDRRLRDGLSAAEEKGFDLAIIDTPPAAGSEALTAAEVADLILVPCRPSLLDIDAIRRTAQLVRSTGLPAFAVINAAPHSATTLLADTRRLITDKGLLIAPVVLRERSAYRAAWPLGKSVTEIEPRGKAAEEISELKNWVFAQLQVCTPDGAQQSRTLLHG
jgi:chromosome partitioning protein